MNQPLGAQFLALPHSQALCVLKQIVFPWHSLTTSPIPTHGPWGTQTQPAQAAPSLPHTSTRAVMEASPPLEAPTSCFFGGAGSWLVLAFGCFFCGGWRFNFVALLHREREVTLQWGMRGLMFARAPFRVGKQQHKHCCCKLCDAPKGDGDFWLMPGTAPGAQTSCTVGWMCREGSSTPSPQPSPFAIS